MDTEQFMQGDMPRGAGAWIEIFNMATKAVSIDRRSLHGSDTDSRIASLPSSIASLHPFTIFPKPDQNICTCHDTCAIITPILLLTAPHRLLRRFAGKEKNQMKAYFDSIEKEVPEQLQQVFLNRRDTAVITIDMHDGHLSTDPDCPCPSPRGREIIEPLNHFMNEARTLGLPIIHVRSTLRKGGADEKLFPSAWRMVFPVTVGKIPNIAEHAIEGTRWNRMSIDVHDEDYMVTTKKRLSAFYPTDLELLLRNLGIRRVVLTGCMTDCCVINTAFDAANRDFRVVVPRDLTRGSEHLEEPALRMISLHLGLVVDSDALLDEWRSQD